MTPSTDRVSAGDPASHVPPVAGGKCLWRSIETLAADGHSVLLWLGDFHVASKLNIRIGYRTPAGFFGTGSADRKLVHVTHWMPLPSAPVTDAPAGKPIAVHWPTIPWGCICPFRVEATCKGTLCPQRNSAPAA